VQEGLLAIAVVRGPEGGAAARALRPHADILVTTSDPEFLPTLAQSLWRPS